MEEYLYPHPFKKEWVTGAHEIDDVVVRWAESFGEDLTKSSEAMATGRGGKTWSKRIKPLTTSQIRRFFGEMKRIQSDFSKHGTEVPLIKAKLAYAVGREYDKDLNRAGSKIKEFYDELSIGLSAIEGNANNFRNFVKIVEAIVAFHKYAGGREN